MRTAERDPRVAFSEDLYLKMSVEMIEKNEEIVDLKKRISVLETQLNNGEGSQQSSEQILRAGNESWKEAYDLHVDLNSHSATSDNKD
jgi:cell division septum initiation protein DivIVA